MTRSLRVRNAPDSSMPAWALLVILAGTLSACSITDPDTPPRILLEPRDSVAMPGTEVAFRVSNRARVDVAFNSCLHGSYDRQEDGNWVRLPPSLALCSIQEFVLQAGRSFEVGFLPLDGPGLYRGVLSFRIAGQESRIEIVSSSFEVRNPNP